MELITGSMLSLKGVLIALCLLLVSGYALVSPDAHAEETNFLVSNPSVESSFRDDILTRAGNVENTVNNMLTGDVEIYKAEKYISYEVTFSKDQTAISPEDMKVNKAYMAYLMAASNVVDAYTYEDPGLQDKINLMNEKKNLI